MNSLAISQTGRQVSAQVWGEVELAVSWEQAHDELMRSLPEGVDIEDVEFEYLKQMLPKYFAHIPHVTRANVAIRFEPVRPAESHTRLLRLCRLDPAQNGIELMVTIHGHLMARIAAVLEPAGALARAQTQLRDGVRETMAAFPPVVQEKLYRAIEADRREIRTQVVKDALSSAKKNASLEELFLVGLHGAFISKRQRSERPLASKHVAFELISAVLDKSLAPMKEFDGLFDSLRAQRLIEVYESGEHGTGLAYRLSQAGHDKLKKLMKPLAK